jgi:hypothetical protein
MLKCHPPSVEQPPPQVLSEEELCRRLKACEGSKFEDRRVVAALRVLSYSAAGEEGHLPVGPVWHGSDRSGARRLRSCYQRAGSVASGVGAWTFTLPAIWTGIFPYPTEMAAEVEV